MKYVVKTKYFKRKKNFPSFESWDRHEDEDEKRESRLEFL